MPTVTSLDCLNPEPPRSAAVSLQVCVTLPASREMGKKGETLGKMEMKNPPAPNTLLQVLTDVLSTPFLGMPQDSYFSRMGNFPHHLRFLSGFQSAASPQDSSHSFSFRC